MMNAYRLVTKYRHTETRSTREEEPFPVLMKGTKGG